RPTDQLGDGIDALTWIPQVADRGAGHAGTELLVTDEGGFPGAQLVDRRFPDVVQERRQPGDQLRRRERRGEQCVAEDVMAVPPALLHSLAGLELRHDARQEPSRIEQLQSALYLIGH